MAGLCGVSGEYAVPERVARTVQAPNPPDAETDKRPLFILMDGTWAEARKMSDEARTPRPCPYSASQPRARARRS